AGSPAEVPNGDMAPPPPSSLTERMPRTFTPAAHTAATNYYAQKNTRRPVRVAQNGEPTPAMNGGGMPNGGPMPAYVPGPMGGMPPAHYDHPQMPGYAWPAYAAHPNYAAVTYPKQYSPTAWPFIGPFYPYPQVPLGWRKVSLEWDDGWWMLDFKDGH
ncbi:MAG TPA: hypothetical protein VD863_25500, partial [Bradyrhizobium sp.]|nr:hypothetical protein [Bradyrhizobium sp.]